MVCGSRFVSRDRLDDLRGLLSKDEVSVDRLNRRAIVRNILQIEYHSRQILTDASEATLVHRAYSYLKPSAGPRFQRRDAV